MGLAQTQTQTRAYSLYELQTMVGNLVMHPSTQNVWIVAETSDVRVKGGHCYMELLQKDPNTGVAVAKCRAMIWGNQYAAIDGQFYAATGQHLGNDMKVMLRVSARFSALYDYSLNITAVNPEYTLGDLLQRRNAILKQLQADGILDLNRQLAWPRVPQRIAVVSAGGAAGYGDFMNQLHHNPYRLRFLTRLFEATMQGSAAPASIINALDRIAQEADQWDGVVIIRGGGATSDLQCFEDYNLAACIAQYPLPVAIGLGHERDVTLLDYVANMRLKTPTAVAEWLVGCGAELLGYLQGTAKSLALAATARIGGSKEQLAQASMLVPLAAKGALERQQVRLHTAATALGNISARRLQPRLATLDNKAEQLRTALATCLQRHRDRLDSKAILLAALSPEATLKRGYTITRINGHAVADASLLAPGAVIETTFASGVATSQVINTVNK